MSSTRTLILLVCSSIIAALAASSCINKTEDTMKPPVAKRVPHELTAHGHIRNDNYFWMNQREDPEVVTHLNAENEYSASVLNPVNNLMEELYNEMTDRIKKDDETVPYLKNGYYYQTRYSGESEYPVYVRWRAEGEKQEELLFNINELAEGHSYFSDNYHYISPDNRYAAIGFDTVSRRNYTLRVKDLSTGAFLPVSIPMTTGTASWGADNKTIFYTVRDPNTLRSYKVMRHLLGTDPSSDKAVFEEKDEAFYASAFNSKSGHYIIIASTSTMTSEMRILDATKPTDDFILVEPRRRGHEYFIYPAKDKLYIRTNDDAINFRVMVTDISKPGRKYWRELYPYNPDVLTESIEVFDSYIVAGERFNGLGRFYIRDISGNGHHIAMEEESFVLGTSVNAELASGVFRFVYSSLTTPRSVYDYDMKSRKKILLKETEIPGGFNKSNYETRRVFATAPDGTKIPVSLVYRKGLRKDGDNPALIYGYGSYGYSMEPWFRSSVVSLLDRGFVYAIAHVRGGEEMGRLWYENGKLLKKVNTFTDFIACSEFLIEEQYTSREKLFAMGGSAGGLLMGVVSNLRPDLYKGVIAQVPFVDVVTTMLDESIPLTTGEYDEWGNPKDKEYYDYMLSYSPYDNVREQAYPNMLVTTGFHDSQVQYWEPAKWVAKLREHNTSANLILLHTNMDFGHGGASGRFRVFRDIAMEYAFIIMLL